MRYLFLLILSIAAVQTRAQHLNTGPIGLNVKTGTVFHVSGLTLQPSQDFPIMNQRLDLDNSVSNTLLGSHVRRVYSFSNTTAPFHGSIKINYDDSELNGHHEGSLEVHVHNGWHWRAINTAARHTANNTVNSDTVTATPLNEITLASPVHPELQDWIDILGNPVRGNRLFLVNRLSLERYFSLYTIDGRLLHSGTLRPGLNQLPVNSYANGIYILRCHEITEKVILQR